MKKKKHTLVLLVIILVPVAAAFLAAYYHYCVMEQSYSSDETVGVAVTDDGDIYAMYDTGDILEIMKLRSDGYIIGMDYGINVPLVPDEKSGVGIFNCGGTVFKVEAVLDRVTGGILRQDIYKLDDSLSATLFHSYPKGQPDIKCLSSDGGRLFVAMLGDDGDKAYVDIFDLNGEQPAAPEKTIDFSSPFDDDFYDVVYMNGSLYASTMGGELLRCSEGATVNVLQSPAYEGVSYCAVTALGSDGKGVFFHDATQGVSYYIDAEGTLKQQENPVAKKGEHAYVLASDGPYGVALITKEDTDIMRIAVNGESSGDFTEMKLPFWYLLAKLSLYTLLFTGVGYVLALLIFMFILAIIKSQRFLTKSLMIITPFTLSALAVFGYLQYGQLETILIEETDALARSTNATVTSFMSYHELEKIKCPQFFKTPEHKQMLEKLVVNFGLDKDSAPIESDIFIVSKGEILSGVSISFPRFAFAKDLLVTDKYKYFADCERSGEPTLFHGDGLNGKWSVIISPIYNDDDLNNAPEGYVMTWVPWHDMTDALRKNIADFTRLALIIMLPLIVLLALVFKVALRPISSLHNAMQKVLAGNYEVRLNTATKDEFMRINLAFNKMCSDLKTQMYKLERIRDSYHRFVPRNILPVLEKESILEVNCGDSKRLSVCFCALCMQNLTEMRSVGTDEDFLEYMGVIGDFLNSSLKRRGGVLMSSDIDLRGLLAIFPSSAEGCREFASDVRQFCSMEYSKFGRISPKITVFLHYSAMLYGITGVNDAAFPFLLSDGVDFVMRALPLFEVAQTQIVVTQNILPELQDRNYMEIGWRETLRGRVCKLYVPDGFKPETDEQFSKGLECFYKKDFYNARALFSSVLRNEPANGIVQWYALASDKYLEYPGQFENSQIFGTDVYKADF